MATDSETGDTPAFYTMHDLTEDTVRVLAEIQEAGKPAFITRHGRFVAVITPLAPGQVEGSVLAGMAREIGALLREDGDHDR